MMKYTLLLAAAALAAALSSCVGTGPSAAPVAKCGSCSSAAPAVAKAKTSCSPNLAGMAPTCAGSCSSGDCACVKHPCRCSSPKPVAKTKPKPVVSRPAPPPPEVAKPAPPPPPADVTVTERAYYWEFANPQKRKVLPPGTDPYTQGFLPNPEDKGWVKEREYRLPAGTPVPPTR